MIGNELFFIIVPTALLAPGLFAVNDNSEYVEVFPNLTFSRSVFVTINPKFDKFKKSNLGNSNISFLKYPFNHLSASSKCSIPILLFSILGSDDTL